MKNVKMLVVGHRLLLPCVTLQLYILGASHSIHAFVRDLYI